MLGANIGEPPRKGAGHPCGPHGYAPPRMGTEKTINRDDTDRATQQCASLRMENPSRPRRFGGRMPMGGHEWRKGESDRRVRHEAEAV
jgi:hypothetical protein